MLGLLGAPVLLGPGALAARASAVPASCPSGQPCIVVTVTGSTSETTVVTLQDLQRMQPDFVDKTYPLLAAGGSLGSDEIPDGVWVRSLLTRLPTPIAPQSVTFVSTTTAARRSRSQPPAVLSGATDDLAVATDPGFPFLDGLLPAVYPGDQNIGYIRPQRSAHDANAADFIQESGEIDMTVLTSGVLLSPTISATDTTIPAKTAAHFTASLASTPNTALTYLWTFGDGATATTSGAGVAHTYSTPGSYDASVVVSGADGSYGQSDPLTMTIGKAPPPPPTKTHTPPPGHGGTGSSHHPSIGPSSGSGHDVGATPSPGSSSTGAAATSSGPARPRPAPSSTAAGTAGAGAGTPVAPSDTSTPTPLPASAALQFVDGTLLAGAVRPIAAGASLPPGGVVQTAPAARPASSAAAGRTVLGIVAVLALLGLGAGRELLRLRRSGSR